MKKITKGKKKGFTLIELIAVIAILAILAAIIIPNVISYIDNAKKTAIETDASTIYTSIITKEASLANGVQEDNSTTTAPVAQDWNSYNTSTTVSKFDTTYKLDSNITSSTYYAKLSDKNIAQLVSIKNGNFTYSNGTVTVNE